MAKKAEATEGPPDGAEPTLKERLRGSSQRLETEPDGDVTVAELEAVEAMTAAEEARRAAKAATLAADAEVNTVEGDGVASVAIGADGASAGMNSEVMAMLTAMKASQEETMAVLAAKLERLEARNAELQSQRQDTHTRMEEIAVLQKLSQQLEVPPPFFPSF